MPVGTWPWLVFFVDVVVLFVAVGVAAYLLRTRWDGGSSDVEGWREGASDLAREVRGIATGVERPADPDQVSRRLLPLAGRIQGHVRAAPPAVEEAVYRDLFELGVACQRVALEHRPVGTSPDGVFLEERLETLGREAAALEAGVVDGR